MNKEFGENLVMTAEEARNISDKKNEGDQKVNSYLSSIGKLIGKVAEEGGYTVVYNIDYNVDEKVITRIINYLKSLGYRVTENTYSECFKKLIIEFN